MKHLIFALMFVPLSVLAGLALALIYWSATVGLIGTGFLLCVSADICFNGSNK